MWSTGVDFLGRFLRGLSRRLDELLSGMKQAQFILLWMGWLTFRGAFEHCSSVEVGDRWERSAGSKPVSSVLKWRLIDLFSVHRAAIWSLRSSAIYSPFVPQFPSCVQAWSFFHFFSEISNKMVCMSAQAPLAWTSEWWVRFVWLLYSAYICMWQAVLVLVFALKGKTSAFIVNLPKCFSCKINSSIHFCTYFRTEYS